MKIKLLNTLICFGNETIHVSYEAIRTNVLGQQQRYKNFVCILDWSMRTIIPATKRFFNISLEIFNKITVLHDKSHLGTPWAV